MEKENETIVARMGATGFLATCPPVLFLVGITILFGVMGGNDFYIFLALTCLAAAFWVFYFLRYKAVYEGGVMTVRKPFGKKLIVKEADMAFIRRNRNRYTVYDKDGNELAQIFCRMNNAEKLIGAIEDAANNRMDKRVLNIAEYLEPLNAMLKKKCHGERFELTRAINRSAAEQKTDKHNIPTENDTSEENSTAKNSGAKTEKTKIITDNNTENTENTADKSEENSTDNLSETSNPISETTQNDDNKIPVLRLVNKTDATKRILLYIKGRETNLKFMNTSVVLNTPESFDEAIKSAYEVIEDIITSKIVTVCVTDDKGRVLNSRAFYRKQVTSKEIKDAKLNKSGARVCAWNDKAAKDFISHNF